MEKIYIIGIIISFCINFLLLSIYKQQIEDYFKITFQYTEKEFIGILFLLIITSSLWPFEILTGICLFVLNNKR